MPAIEAYSLEHGQIFMPIYVIKKSNKVILGQCLVKLALENPDLKYSIIYVPFEGWQEAEAWVVEHLIAQAYMNLFEKCELAFTCKDYWLQKEAAKQNQGARTDIPEVTSGMFEGSKDNRESKEVCRIIGEKVGCSSKLVYQFKAIYFDKKNNDIKKKCKDGEMSISAAYDRLMGKSPTKKPKTEPQSQAGSNIESPAPTIEVISCDVLTEAENNIDVGKKKVYKDNGTPPYQKTIITKVAETRIPDGNIWVVMNKEGYMQLFKRSLNAKTGTIAVKVQSFRYEFKESFEGADIYEADHLNSGIQTYFSKDQTEFDNAVKTDMQGEQK